MKKYWFRQKTYGYGVTPISWEGWIATFGLAFVIIFLVFIQRSIITENFIGLLIVILEISIISIIFLKKTQDKTSGKLGWKWGNKK